MEVVGNQGLFDSDLGRRNGHPNWVPVDRALRLVRFFFLILSNFLPLPELLRVLTHLIAIAGSGLWRGAKTAQK